MAETKAIKAANGFRIAKVRSDEELTQEVRTKFDRDEQLAALMEQVEAIAKKTGTPLVKRFQDQLYLRARALGEHRTRKEKQQALRG